MAVPLKQLHNYDMGGPYAGFTGAINGTMKSTGCVNSKVWGLMRAPWRDTGPELEAGYVDA